MLKVTVTNNHQKEEVFIDADAMEFGRGPQRELLRTTILDSFVSRDQLSIYRLDTGRYCLENLGSPLMLDELIQIGKGESRDLEPPCKVTVGYTELTIEQEKGSATIASVDDECDEDERFSTIAVSSIKFAPKLDKDPSDQEMISQWFESLIRVQQTAAHSGQFYEEAAKAVVELIGLDKGIVLIKEEKGWFARSHFPPLRSLDQANYSTRVIARVAENAMTYWESIDDTSDIQGESLMGIESVVASPIFDSQQKINGVVYGSRSVKGGSARNGILPLEAQLVHLLASVVGSGLALANMEAEAARNRVQFEQFASHQVANALERDPTLLDGQVRDITVMFCDIRGFSRISEKLGPQETYRFLSDAMDVLTDYIFAQTGSVIDYYGDGVAAMWNAPCDQPDHAQRACITANAIVHAGEQLDQRWYEKIGQPIRFGIGLNSGSALVGNAGSSMRIKYGPQGHTVNLASRVEGLTKFFGTPLLATQATIGQLNSSDLARRIATIQASGMDTATAIYEICAAKDVNAWTSRKVIYEKALHFYETSRWELAVKTFEQFEENPALSSDLATRVLFEKCVRYAENPVDDFSPTIVFEHK